MTVKELLAMEIGAKTDEKFSLTIKHVKKRWPSGSFTIHQVILFDTTGEILTDVVCTNNIPFTRASELQVVIGEIQAAEAGKKLVVHEWRQQSDTEPDRIDWHANEAEAEIRSKIRCWLVSAYLQSGTEPDKAEVLMWEEFVRTGK